MVILNILGWIVLGLVAGALAKWIMPGKDPGGILVTMVLGIVGALIGGFIGRLLGLGEMGRFSLGSLVLAIVGALILLAAYRFYKRSRPQA